MRDQKESKRSIREFMRNHYSDQDLASALAHARDGKLSYMCCCCFIGIPSAQHPLRTYNEFSEPEHQRMAQALPGAREAEDAFNRIGIHGQKTKGDVRLQDIARRRILIPMIRAEMKRREMLRQIVEEYSVAEVSLVK